MLIIEGGDCLGKTTAAKVAVDYIRKNTEIPVLYVHMSRPNEDRFDFYKGYEHLMCRHAVYDRFHLGGIAYHSEKIPPHRLSVLQGWIYSRGAYVVVMYTTDTKWYRERLEADDRGNILDIDKMLQGNLIFTNMAEQSTSIHNDYGFNVKTLHGEVQFPTEKVIQFWCDQWLKRQQGVY